jgi:hypothetical protein
VSAKGRGKPLVAWQARQPLSRNGLRTSLETTTPFLGRERELDALKEARQVAIDAS